MAGALLYVLLVIGLSGILATLGWVWACDLLGLNKESVSVEITIHEDTEFSEVVDTLEREGLIEYKFLFKLFSWFSHAEEKIAPGTYTLDTEMDYRALISNMGSSSTTSTRRARRARLAARWRQRVDFPTPPLPEAKSIVSLIALPP